MNNEPSIDFILSTNNYYEILGVSKRSTSEEIKRSYKKLVIKYHPDKNNNPLASEVFKKITLAYKILIDDKKRQEYDKLELLNYKDLFYQFCVLIEEICEKYQFNEDEKNELLKIFDPKIFEENQFSEPKIVEEIFLKKIKKHIGNILLGKISIEYPTISNILSIFIN